MHCAGAAAVPGIAAGLYKVRRRDISMRRLFSVRKMRRGGGVVWEKGGGRKVFVGDWQEGGFVEVEETEFRRILRLGGSFVSDAGQGVKALSSGRN